MSEPTEAAPAKKKLHNPLHVTLAVAGLIACLVPARAATRVDPISAMRSQ